MIDNSTQVILAEVGKPVEFQVMATDPDGDNITFSLLENIEGASINQGEEKINSTRKKLDLIDEVSGGCAQVCHNRSN